MIGSGPSAGEWADRVVDVALAANLGLLIAPAHRHDDIGLVGQLASEQPRGPC